MNMHICNVCFKPFESPEKEDKCYACKKKDILKADYQRMMWAKKEKTAKTDGSSPDSSS